MMVKKRINNSTVVLVATIVLPKTMHSVRNFSALQLIGRGSSGKASLMRILDFECLSDPALPRDIAMKVFRQCRIVSLSLGCFKG